MKYLALAICILFTGCKEKREIVTIEGELKNGTRRMWDGSWISVSVKTTSGFVEIYEPVDPRMALSIGDKVRLKVYKKY